ncbi:MAG: FAD-binding oxidoreductase [Caldilineaceae bacterium]|nr:FAD-binding oxidoreductase [Caldilineaceae bacterium]
MLATTEGKQIRFGQEAIQTLAAQLQGELIRPEDEAYDLARRVWNGMIDRYPALIVRCATPQDVMAALAFARRYDLPLAVRGGGHNVAGHGTCEDGLVIDLSPMNMVDVDVTARTVRAGGGATWGMVDAATQPYGLATPGGVVSDTGIAGLTLGGGLGWLRNKHGLSCDNLLAAEVVTADGRLLHASESDNPDLFWAIRGGGGNFGIVTTFTYQLHPVGPEVWMTAVFHDGVDMEGVLRYFRDYCESASDEESLLAVCGVFPSGAEHFPQAVWGRPFVLLAGLYSGDPEEGRQVMQPLRDFAEPLLDASDVMSYQMVQTFFDADYPKYKLRYYWKSLNLTRMDDEVIALIADHATQQPSLLNTTDIWHIGGAVRRVAEEDTAFHGRHVSFLLNAEANWEDAADDDVNMAWVREMLAATQPFSDGSRYLNFAGLQEEGDQMMVNAFAGKYAKLAQIKQKYDPDNTFRLNQNIKPQG